MNLAAGMANVETMQIDWKTANTGTGSGNTALYSVI